MMHESRLPRPLLYVLPTLLALGLGSRAAEAQAEAPTYELFAGYAFLRDQEVETNFPLGWDVSIARRLTNSLGVVADVGGNYKSESGVRLSVHAFLGGARYSFRGESLTPYVEALAGLARASASGGGASGSNSDFAVQGGVGLGVKIKENLWFRTGFDARNIFSEGSSTQEFRGVAGVTFGFGGSRGAGAPAISSPPSRIPEPAPVPTPAPRTPPVEPPVQPPPFPRPAPAVPGVAPGLLSRAQESLRGGSYSEAATAFRDYLSAHATYKFTIPIGVYCDVSNLAQQVRSGDPQELIVLRVAVRGQPCWGLYWGLFGSRSEARSALDRLPSALRATGQVPTSVTQLLNKAQ